MNESSELPANKPSASFGLMSADTVIAEIEALPPTERSKVFAYVDRELSKDEAWIPGSFRQGMADAEAGRLVEMDQVLAGARPPGWPS